MISLRTKNFSSDKLRKNLREHKGIRAIVRLGSVTPTESIIIKKKGKKARPFVEINTVEAIQNSRSKLKMKAAFAAGGVKQADWWVMDDNDKSLLCYKNEDTPIDNVDGLPYPILAKRIFGFKGLGMHLINNAQEMQNFLANPKKEIALVQIAKIDAEIEANAGNDEFVTPEKPTFFENPSSASVKNVLNGYYFEKFHSYAREYRLHVAGDECFMSWRKLRRRDAEDRHYFNSSNCNWVGPDHELYDKPKCWDAMVEHAVNTLKSTGLDIGAADVRVQSNNENKPEFIVCEINSAPALGESGNAAYYDAIVKLVEKKQLITK